MTISAKQIQIAQSFIGKLQERGSRQVTESSIVAQIEKIQSAEQQVQFASALVEALLQTSKWSSRSLADKIISDKAKQIADAQGTKWVPNRLSEKQIQIIATEMVSWIHMGE